MFSYFTVHFVVKAKWLVSGRSYKDFVPIISHDQGLPVYLAITMPCDTPVWFTWHRVCVGEQLEEPDWVRELANSSSYMENFH